jgi:hypothetical protein
MSKPNLDSLKALISDYVRHFGDLSLVADFLDQTNDPPELMLVAGVGGGPEPQAVVGLLPNGRIVVDCGTLDEPDWDSNVDPDLLRRAIKANKPLHARDDEDCDDELVTG